MKTYEIMEKVDKLGKEMLNKQYRLIDKNSNFAININEGEIATIKEYVAGDGFLALSNGSVRIAHLTGLEEWEEVKKPVDFMAAVKSGKRFKLINKDDAKGILTRYMDLNTFMNTLANMWSKELSKVILTEGKFYIED